MSPSTHSNNLNMDAPNARNQEVLPRDKEQTNRLHEPDMMISSIDPITGNEIEDLTGKPYLVDGNMVIYFESNETRQAYQDLPTDHPFRLQDNPNEDGEAEG